MPIQVHVNGVYPAHIEYLRQRGISRQTIADAGLYSSLEFVGEAHGPSDVIAFPYRDKQKTIRAVKFRTIYKEFSAIRGGEQVPYGLDQEFDTALPLVIVEGELDQLSCREAGIKNCVSVPSGAKAHDRFQWLQGSEAFVRQFNRYILATDNDPPGQILLEELSRRLGIARCLSVTFPDACKDANDVLKKRGNLALRQMIANAVPLPVAGVSTVLEHHDRVLEVFRSGLGRGQLTGWPNVDNLYSVVPGQLTVVTGIPSHGKSQWLDALAVNLAEECDWRFAFCSFETEPDLHALTLLAQHARRPVREGFGERLSEPELEGHLDWLTQHFVFIDFAEQKDLPTVDAILEKAESAVLRHGCRGLIIDPYNYVLLSKRENETQAVSEMLTRLRLFARMHSVHIWMVAHPAKAYEQNYGAKRMPGGYDISGSAAWFAKCDFGITVFRHDDDTVTIWTWKVRHRHLGRPGRASLEFQPATGMYLDGGVEVHPPSWYGREAGSW